MKMKLRKPGVYFMELLILIAGITISFMLNEWRQSRIAGDEQARIMKQLRADLERDTAAISAQLEFIELVQESGMTLLTLDSLEKLSSIRTEFASMINTVSTKFSSSTFVELESTGKLSLIEDDSTRHGLIEYYTKHQPSVYSWHDVDKSQYLPRITQFVEQKLPFSFGFALTGMSSQDSLRFIHGLQSDEFRHIVQFNMVVKSGIAQGCEQLRSSAETLLERLEER